MTGRVKNYTRGLVQVSDVKKKAELEFKKQMAKKLEKLRKDADEISQGDPKLKNMLDDPLLQGQTEHSSKMIPTSQQNSQMIELSKISNPQQV